MHDRYDMGRQTSTGENVRPKRLARLMSLLVLALLAAACFGGSAHHPPKPAVVPPVTATTTEPPQSRPNILVIEADDMRTDELRFMPNVRAYIERTGLNFANSFAPYPLCCPSRSSFLSGEYAHNHGVLGTRAPFGFQAFNDSHTLATALQAGGYDTALVGKYLNGYGQQPIHGTNQSSLHYVPPGWTDWMAGSDHLWKPGQKFQGGTYNYFHLTQLINGKLRQFPNRYNTTVQATQTRGLISKYAASPKPWFIWWTPIAPHYGNPRESDDPPPIRQDNGRTIKFETPARPKWVMGIYDKQITHGLGVPPGHPAETNMSDKPLYLRRQPLLNAQEKAALTNVSRQRAEALYVLDHQIGITLNRLRSTGQYANTVLVFTSDNGYYLGEHRKRQGKINLHEPSLRVPFLISGRGIPHGVRYDPITTVDLASTFLNLAGLSAMPRTDGINMVPVIKHGDRGWKVPVVTEGMMSAYPKGVRRWGFNSQLNTRGLRLGRWKITMYQTGEVELYDLQKDPLELNSLQANPKYAGVLRMMRRLELQYMNCRQAQCRRPLPKRWQVSVAEERSITLHEMARTEQYYNS